MPSIKDIARMTGVSIATVSRVLNNNLSVSESTRQKVKDTIYALEYYPNALARGLKTKTSKTVGLLLPEIQNMSIPIVTLGLEDILKENGYIALLSYTFYDDKEEHRSLLTFAERKIDALVHIGPREYARKNTYFMRNILGNVPLFLINDIIDEDNTYCIYNDEEEGAYLAAKHLIQQGHKHIAFINGNPLYSSYFNKKKGFIRALREEGLSLEPLLYSDYQKTLQEVFQPEEAYKAMTRIMKLPSPPTAIFAASDLLAVGIIKYLHENKVRIPEECSVVGFDNVPISQHIYPPLTTVDQKLRELGQFAGRLMLKVLKEGPLDVKIYSFSPTLIIRESSCLKKNNHRVI
jgi:LacI family transcriptional regulator